ncbi:MAG TPA: SCP2 sterol-binding domain-containing protein [Burkholderiales bacterium]|nr:SCP2 sterol-binding domain-containing protein [Burkholderiales bacterium]
MFEPLALPAINRLLRANTWALEKLSSHSGKTALLACPPFELRCTVLDSGELAPAARDATPDVTITATAGSLLRIAARDESAWNAAQVSGDVDFAGVIDYVLRNLEWDYEESLSSVFGDIAAHRIAGAVREVDRWGRAAALNLGQAFAEYAKYEQPLLASRQAVDEFNREVDEVRDHAARLEKRLELLRRRPSDA